MKFKPRLKVWRNSTGNNVFCPETFQATSYKWWIYVKKIKGQVVFNDYNYSVTTGKHQHAMRHFLKTELKIKSIVYVNQRESLSEGLFLDSFCEALALAEYRLTLKNRRAAFYEDQKSIIDDCKKDIAILKKLGAKAKIDLAGHRINAKTEEELRLAKQREKSKVAKLARQTVVNEFKSQYESTQAVEV